MAKKKRSRFLAYTDGSTEGNCGAGGYAYIVTNWNRDSVIRKFSKYVEPTVTNNQMELQAIIDVILWFLENTKSKYLVVNTDSKYCCDGYNEWMEKWRNNKWKTTKGTVKNLDLWKTLYDLKTKSNGRVHLNKIKGHSGIKFNVMAHNMAKNIWQNKINKLNERKSEATK